MTARTPEDVAREILGVADRAVARARRANNERIRLCPNQSKGQAALDAWRKAHPYVNEDEARVQAVTEHIRGSVVFVKDRP